MTFYEDVLSLYSGATIKQSEGKVMTVGELIKYLEAFPSDILVVREDYFNGYVNIFKPRLEDGVTELLIGASRRVTAIIIE